MIPVANRMLGMTLCNTSERRVKPKHLKISQYNRFVPRISILVYCFVWISIPGYPRLEEKVSIIEFVISSHIMDTCNSFRFYLNCILAPEQFFLGTFRASPPSKGMSQVTICSYKRADKAFRLHIGQAMTDELATSHLVILCYIFFYFTRRILDQLIW